MRTTLDIEKPILEELKRLRKKEKKPMGQIASSLLAQALKQREQAAGDATGFEWITAGMGARIDLSDKDALYRILDQE